MAPNKAIKWIVTHAASLCRKQTLIFVLGQDIGSNEMGNFQEDQKVIHKQTLFQAMRCLNELDYDVRSKGMVYLREESKGSELARSKLRELIYDDDGCIRMLAAEALSLTQSYPSDAIPVLEVALEVAQPMEITGAVEPWLRICLGALFNYGDVAISSEGIVWQYLYAQPNQNVMLYAVRLVSRFARFSDASWAILCLLCQHQNSRIQNYARELMSSEEFKSYYKRS